DLSAFDLYTRANALTIQVSYIGARSKDNLLQAIELLNQAVARDPKFLVAYCRLAYAHDFLYITNQDHTPARRALADAAVQTILRLKPDSGEAHLALAQHFYSCYLDYGHARQELAIAQRMLPNSSQVFEVAGVIDRRQGHWEDSPRNFERALQIDPRNISLFHHMSISYQCMRRYNQMAAVLDRAHARRHRRGARCFQCGPCSTGGNTSRSDRLRLGTLRARTYRRGTRTKR